MPTHLARDPIAGTLSKPAHPCSERDDPSSTYRCKPTNDGGWTVGSYHRTVSEDDPDAW